ncbi:MAG: glutamine--tRNA ligase/YqeY domain fusion protein [Defluviitaleaceae bacterium]|nr:glutamine--tRNA ligase/YqeY domain fusion protein [Defluviitaleaceae bacterium]
MLQETGNFIRQFIQEDLKGRLDELHTRFPPEPNGYLHIGSAKAVYINFEMAKLYGGKCNLRFDDTNPLKEETRFVEAIKEDIKWLGYDWEDRLFFASDYFDIFYECAVKLIKKGFAYVCELSQDEVRAARGAVGEPGRESPFRSRPADESLALFGRMKSGEFPDGAMTLRAKIDMASPNMNMRDPVVYRIMHRAHYNTGDKWCIYPMYDFAHPLEDAIEGITHSMCSIEFEDNRPLYDWYLDHLDFEARPRQIEFAKSAVSHTVMGKRYLTKLVEEGRVDGWDDPRMVTLRGMKRRGYPPAAIRKFAGITGVSKAQSKIEFSLLEHCVRESLKADSKVVMAVLDPLKIIIENYPENKTEWLKIENNPENECMGSREVPFTRELFIERADFMENPPGKFFRLSPGKEVRLKGAYYITCKEAIKDGNGKITRLICTHDPETKSGSGFDGRKVKGTLHWVSAAHAVPIIARLYDTLVTDGDAATDDENETDENMFTSSWGTTRLNPDSLIIMPEACGEPCVAGADANDRFQFMRNGYFCLDEAYTAESDKPVFNRIVTLKSSFKPV